MKLPAYCVGIVKIRFDDQARARRTMDACQTRLIRNREGFTNPDRGNRCRLTCDAGVLESRANALRRAVENRKLVSLDAHHMGIGDTQAVKARHEMFDALNAPALKHGSRRII